MKIGTMQAMIRLLPLITCLVITSTVGYEYNRRNRLLHELDAAELKLAQMERRLTATSVGSQVVYSCALHPEVRSNKPGDCPKCGKSLSLFTVESAELPSKKRTR